MASYKFFLSTILFTILTALLSFTKWSIVPFILLLLSFALFLFYSLWTKEGSFLNLCVSASFFFSMIALAFFELGDSLGF